MKKISAISALAAAAAFGAIGMGTAAAQPVDYGALPVNPNVITDSSAYVPVPPVQNPNGQTGVQQVFNHRDGSRGINNTILVLPNPPAAIGTADQWRSQVGSLVSNPVTNPIDVGQGGTLTTGMSPNGMQSVSVLIYADGNTANQVIFNGPPNDPVPVDLVQQYGHDQTTAIQQQLGL
jgi:hypothetical protein